MCVFPFSRGHSISHSLPIAPASDSKNWLGSTGFQGAPLDSGVPQPVLHVAWLPRRRLSADVFKSTPTLVGGSLRMRVFFDFSEVVAGVYPYRSAKHH